MGIKNYFDKELMLNSNIKMSEIQETIISKSNNSDGNIHCPFSDDNASNLVLRIKIRNSNEDNFMEFMNDYEKQLLDLKLRGIDGITKIEKTDNQFVNYDENGAVINDKEIMLQTEGSELLDILCQDFVDATRTTTNDIVEICDVFGIEAVRQKIYDELTTVYKGEESTRHIELIADVMTYRGRLMQIDRHGINRNGETGVISKASFEESVNMFVKAAVFAETDKMKGVSANILAGQLCNCGTNNFQVLIDEDKIMKYSVEEEDIIVKKDLSFQEISKTVDKDFEKVDDVTHEDFEFGFGLENTKEFNIGNLTPMSGIKIDTSKSNLVNVNNEENNKEEEVDIYNIPIDEEGDEESETKTIVLEEENEEKVEEPKKKKNSKKNNVKKQNENNIVINIQKLDEDQEQNQNEDNSDDELLVEFNEPPKIKKIAY